jgi:ribonuclease P protein component
MIKKKYCLSKTEKFKDVFKNGLKIFTDSFIFLYKKNNVSYIRFGISVNKKNKNSVLRNKIKRQVRSMLKNIILEKLSYNYSYDFIIVVRKFYLENSHKKNFFFLTKGFDFFKKKNHL